jgi:hypothetical protein
MRLTGKLEIGGRTSAAGADLILKRRMETTDYTEDTDLKRVMKMTAPTQRVIA